MHRHRCARLLAASILASSCSSLLADETYVGTNADWSDPTAWSNDAVPTSADNVYVTPTVAAGTNTLTGESDMQMNTLTIGATGGGTAIFSNSFDFSTSALTILPGGKIDAGGSITTGEILNSGLITATEFAANVHFLANTTLINQGNIATQTGGSIEFYGNGSVLDNSNGTFTASGTNANNSALGSIALQNCNSVGGQFNSIGTDCVTFVGGSLSNATVNGNVRFYAVNPPFVLSNDTINGNNTLLNAVDLPVLAFQGELRISGFWNVETIKISGPVSLDGNGTFSFKADFGAFPNVTAADANSSLTIGVNQTIVATCSLGAMTFTNLGTFQGNSTLYVASTDSLGNPIFLNRGNLTSSGLLGANNSMGVIDNTNGTISISGTQSLPPHSPNTLGITHVTISGGTLATDAKAQIQFGLSDVLNNLSMQGNFSVSNSSSSLLTLSNITIGGALAQSIRSTVILAGPINNNANWTTANITFAGDQTISGTGSISLANSSITTTDPTASLTIASGQTLQGYGTIGATTQFLLNNAATINANTANKTLTIAATLNNTGALAVAPTSTLVINAPLTSTIGSITSNGTLQLNANAATSTITGNGTLAIAANTSLISDALRVNTLTINGAVQIRPNAPAVATSKLQQLSLASTASLDLTNNALIVEITDNTTKPTLQNEIAIGSLFSSTSTAPLVLIDNSTRPTPYTTFAGQPVDSTSLLIAPALLGDATLDGSIDLNDLNTVLSNLGVSTPAWTSGNFDGAPTIDLNDLNDVLNNLGSAYPSTSSVLAAESLLVSPAPEPTSLSLFALVVPLIARRRR